MPRRPAPRARTPALSKEPGLQPAVNLDTPVREKWARVQLERDERLLRDGYRFDAEAADRGVAFFNEFVRHFKGRWAGQPLRLEPWQLRPLRRLLGWKRPDGTRRYRKMHWEVARKNGKSLMASGIALYGLFGDQEPGAEVYSAAVDKDQAEITFGDAKRMVLASPELMAVASVYKYAIVFNLTGSSYKPLSKESRNKDGLNIHMVVRDELHQWSDRDFLEKLDTASAARTQPITATFTTAGDDLESLWGEEHEYALSIARGDVVRDDYLPVIYRVELDQDWRDPAVWRLANPNWGVSVSPDYIREQYEEACRKPAMIPGFQRYHLNRLAARASQWMNMEAWDACPDLPGEDELAEAPCWIGVDLSSKIDTTAVVRVHRLPGGRFAVVPRIYVPEAGLEERERRERVPYRAWVQAGAVRATPGNVVDYTVLQADIMADAAEFKVQEVCYDPFNAGQFEQDLQREGVTTVEVQQTMRNLNAPTKELLNLVLERRLLHGRHPALRWQVSNAMAIEDSKGNLMLSKRHSGGRNRRRIDAAAATVTAMARAMVGEDGGCVYDTRGVTVL